MRLIVVLCLVVPLSGCWFIFIPGSVIDSIADGLSGSSGNLCVAENAYVGQWITIPGGKTGKITKLEGESRRCQQPGLPIRAVVEIESTTP